MKKTSVDLGDDEIARLERLAEREGISQAQVIRNAILAYLPRGEVNRDFRLLGSGAGPGDSVADHAEEELLEGFGA